MVKKIVNRSSPDPQSAIRMFILEKSLSHDELKNMKRITRMREKYNLLSESQKSKIIQFTGHQIKTKFLHEENFFDQIYSFCIISSLEKKYHHTQKLIEYLIDDKCDTRLLKKICQTLFEIIDNEYALESNTNIISASCLAFLIELGMRISEHKLDRELGADNSIYIMHFITSNLLARSNVNNEEIRIALVYYLSRIENESHIHLHKILSRFGQSLLEHVFSKYFSDPQKNSIAFYFLAEHLNEFLSGSASLAEMSNALLQTQMLKYPDEFVSFLQMYVIHTPKKMEYFKSMTIHFSFLIKKSFEINQVKLIDGLKGILLKHLDFIKEINRNLYIESCDIIIDILSHNRSKRAREFISYISTFDVYILKDKFQKNKIKNFQVHSKSIIIEQEKNDDNDSHPSPLEEILLLAS